MNSARNEVSSALQGLRILDLSMWWAGPRATRLLVEAGAEVIKVEAPKYPDPWRGATLIQAETKGMLDHLSPGQRVNVSPGFNLENHSKLGLTLDLARHLYRIWPDAASLSSATRSLGHETSEVQQAFRWLETDGVACGVPQTMNFSDEPHLALCSSAALCPN